MPCFAIGKRRYRVRPAACDPARAQCGTVAMIDSVKIDAFARSMTDKLDNGDIN